ncbi:MAG: AraC family transcriptional regulator [Spirochaetales bacterium]|nr:AraC family transcriptional regulator [Spirochaetales bacterium]
MSVFGSQSIEDFLAQDYRHYTRSDEKETIRFLLTGDLAAVQALDDHDWDYVLYQESPLRHLKNRIICFITVLCREAIELGAPDFYCFGASDFWINEVEENLTRANEITYYDRIVLSYRKAIPKDDHRSLAVPVLKTMDYVEKHLYENCSLAEAARECALHRDYLSRLFHRETGMTFRAYVAQEKMKRARQLLMTTDHGIVTISDQLNLSSASYFIKLFKKSFGITPHAFRKRMG